MFRKYLQASALLLAFGTVSGAEFIANAKAVDDDKSSNRDEIFRKCNARCDKKYTGIPEDLQDCKDSCSWDYDQ